MRVPIGRALRLLWRRKVHRFICATFAPFHPADECSVGLVSEKPSIHLAVSGLPQERELLIH